MEMNGKGVQTEQYIGQDSYNEIFKKKYQRKTPKTIYIRIRIGILL